MQTGIDGICEFCQYASGDEFGAGFSVYYTNIWRDFGIFAGFCVFNYFVVFLCSWLYLGGLKKLKPKNSGNVKNLKPKLGKNHKGEETQQHSEAV